MSPAPKRPKITKAEVCVRRMPSFPSSREESFRCAREMAKERRQPLLDRLSALPARACRVYILQFMKGRKCGECLAAEKCLPNITIHLAGLDSFVMRDNPAPADVELAKQGLEIAMKLSIYWCPETGGHQETRLGALRACRKQKDWEGRRR